jgi:alpha-beta hydrolase superfamily lysophospholipase
MLLVRKLALVLVAGFSLLNLAAYHHARAFFFYTNGEERTPAPEALSWGEKAKVLLTGIKVPKPRAYALPGDVGLPFEEIVIPGRDGVELAGWWLPHNPAAEAMVLLFHGYNSEKSGLLPEALIFHALGLEVVMVDFPGHGDSPGRQTTLGVREAEDVTTALDWARARWPERSIYLYGHSMGGAAVMRAMALHGAKPDGAIVESVFDTLLDAIRFRFRLMSLPSFPAAELLLFWGGRQLGVDGFAHDIVAYADEVETPVLMIHGARDNRASIAGAERVFEALRVEKKFLVIESAGHVNPCVVEPGPWRDAVSDFIVGR